MISININPQTAVPLIVGVGSTILALLLMLIKIPHSDYSFKLTNSKLAIVVSFLICSFMMFYAMNEYGQPDIKDWDMFLMLTIYIVVHFSTSIISYSMIALLKTERNKWQSLFVPGLFVSAIVAFLLLESYKSGNMNYFWFVCAVALIAFLIQSVTYIVHFDRAYKNSIRELENYYDEDESHKIKWVRFCYVISMLTNLFILVYLCLYWFLDYKLEVASLYTIWYLIYMLYLSSNFISFLGSHKLVLDAFAHKALSGEDIIQMINQGKRRRGRQSGKATASSSINEAEFRKLEKTLEEWVEQKRFREYDKSREDIARELNTTKEILHYYFITKKGVDFKTWRTELRINEAKRLLLEDKNASTNIIAEASGFSDRSNFHRQFVKIVGCSPKQWRDSDGNSASGQVQ
ncbi:MAG: helix-turn-helix domain-containing protein [Bacteroidales bacterium]|nr:helix-turn-helix domain-containing protein [Bacteroidales bacterium]